MIPSFPPSGVRDGSPGRRQEEVRRQVSMAQECTEAAGLPYVQDHFSHPSADPGNAITPDQPSRGSSHEQPLPRYLSSYPTQSYKDAHHAVPQASQERAQADSALAKVKLTKASGTKEITKFFVRSAGGMSVPMPEYTGASEGHRVVPDPLSVPRLQAASEGKPASSGYLPLSVELIAGRGQTSIPSDGHRNTVSPKVRSLPPSQTLALSASLIKSYFTSGGTGQPGRGGTSSTPDAETVKTKVMGLWNNVKYGWTVNLKTNFSRDSPVYLLGNVYHKSLGEDGEDAEESQQHGMQWFKRHFHSLVWCTYRRQFPALQDSSLTTDCGWGCMLRSGQMMLSQALTRHFLSREWRYNKPGPAAPHEETIHRAIVRWVGDAPSPHCPLSLHNLVHLGRRLGKKAGDWYGPASVAYICKEAVEIGSKYIPDLKRVCVYVAQDCAVYVQDVLDLCSTSCICDFGFLAKLTKTQVESKPPAASSSSPHTLTNTNTTSYSRTSKVQSASPNSENTSAVHKDLPVTHSVTHTQSLYSHAASQLPQTDQSADVNITRIKIDSEVNDQPIRLYVNHSEDNKQSQNGHGSVECKSNSSSVRPPGHTDLTQLAEQASHLYPDLSSLTQREVNPPYSVSVAQDNSEMCVESEISMEQENSSRQVSSEVRLKSNSLKDQSPEDEIGTSISRQEQKRHTRDTEDVGERLCPKCENWRSVLIMVPVRLGGETLNPIYAPCLYSLFTHDLSVGIIGGRPKHSLYFVGFQEDSLIHLDPHLVQDAVMVTQPNFPLTSYHCQAPRKMALSRMDPSATLGFYCHTRTDFLRLLEELPEMVTPKQPGLEYPIFEFVYGRSQDSNAITRQVTSEDQLAATLPQDTPLLPQDSEEFVFL